MTKKEIKDYIQAIIKHGITLSEYGNFFVSTIKDYAKEAEKKCNDLLLEAERSVTKKQKNELEKKIKSVLSDFEKKVKLFIEEQLEEIDEAEDKFLEEVVEKALGINLIVPATILGILALVPIASAGTPENFGKSLSDKLGNVYNSILNRVYVFGDEYEDVLGDFESQFNTFHRGLDADAETMGYSLADEYDRIVFTKNDKKIKGYIWSAILDTSTCIACGSLDGTKYENISDVPFYPVHDHCRCRLIPYNEDIEDLIPENYQEWFESQNKETKRQILGKTRSELYEQGMKIKNFVNNNKITPLKDLKLNK